MKTSLLFAVVLASFLAAGCDPVDDPNAGPADAGQIDTIPDADIPLAHIGLAESNVVCETCSQELLAAKTQGIRDAMGALVLYAGADIRPAHGPATFHLSGDGTCGPYSDGTTGFCSTDSAGRAQLCLFDVEKLNRFYPFTPENAVLMRDQLLPVHEALHAWFFDRVSNYGIEEPFCKFASFVISGALMSGAHDYCEWFAHDNRPDSADRLMYYLCQLGMDEFRISETLNRTAATAYMLNRTLTTEEFADIVTDVLGQDSRPAFKSSGLLP